MKYVEPVFRPPAEADSLIIQAAYGCPHNSCRFCGMYKGVKYRERDHAELFREIEKLGKGVPETSRVFLADGDVMHLHFERLREILEWLNEAFPRLARVNLYANGSSILAKSDEQLRKLRELKLNTLYMGLESGDEEILRAHAKGETAGGMVEAVRRAQECGLKCSVMVLLGLGGRALSERHAKATAEALNRMQPVVLSALRFIEVPGTIPPEGHQTLTEHEAVSELRMIIENLDLKKTVFRANHTSNPAPLGGRFPQDKERLLAELDELLDSKYLDKKGPGRQPMFL